MVKEGSANVLDVPVWKGPVIHVASMCQHIGGDNVRHRVGVFDLGGLVSDLGAYVPGPIGVVPLGGIRMGTFGIVLSGFAAVDVMAVMRNVLWEDEHCLHCCGTLMRFIEPLHHKVLTRCGPTIGSVGGVTMDEARRIIDEYWTD